MSPVVSSFESLARSHTEMSDADLEHMQRLVSAWGMLSDLCFSDLLLFAPIAGTDGSRFVVLGQARPTTSQTLHLDVLVGRIVDEFERSMVARAWRRREIVETEDVILGRGERARVQCIPVRRGEHVIAILSRESPLAAGRRPGQLERIYIDTFQRLVEMITRGQFPFDHEIGDKSSPRIGDGSLLLDQEGKIVFASPNAMNAVYRMGFVSNVLGADLQSIGIPNSIVDTAFKTGNPVADELEPRLNVSVALTCVPLLDAANTVTGALVMLRDVTDLRRLDRLLISKDATIREIHHRVKNNLQTISSLLDLQARRLDQGPARTALDDAHRRIRSIALVHEILSREANEQVGFNEIIETLVRVASQSALLAEQEIEFSIVGDAGELDAEVATPLAVVLAELLANAVEHAFTKPGLENDKSRLVVVSLNKEDKALRLEVRDNGSGLPDNFSVHETRSLGLSIVRSLVVSQLQGSIEMDSADSGTTVVLLVPLGPL